MLLRWNDFDFNAWDRAFPDFSLLRQEMDRMFGAPARFGGALTRDSLDDREIQVRDTGESIVLVAELPGVSEQDLKLELDDKRLTLSAQRKRTVPKGYEARRRERSDIEFSRTFVLPYVVDAGQAEAKFRQGILTLTLPKAEVARPRQIPVSVT